MMKVQIKCVLLGLGLLLGSQVTLAQTTPTTEKTSVATAEKNRQLVINFYNQFFNQHETEIASRVVANDYRQHNPQVPDGKKPFVSYFTDFFKHNPQSHAQIVRSAVDGDLVWLHIHSTNGKDDLGQSIVDIFRVSHGKIVEHWDVIQSVPRQSANNNTMF